MDYIVSNETNLQGGIMDTLYRNPGRCDLDKDTLRGIANMLLEHADEIEVLFPFQANAMRNMASTLDPK
jgi:hypothetical protein